MYEHYSPVHSDFLIHWTGKDIDKDHDTKWTDDHSSTTDSSVTKKYLDRLKNILRFGLWMKKDPKDCFLNVESKEIEVPSVARICFTELKLSEARSHAAQYGRLGIGFKRFFLLDRLGAPVLYYHPTRKNWFFPPYSDDYSNFKSRYHACFFKPMSIKSKDSTFEYKYYDESEWRIIYSDEIKNMALKLNGMDIADFFKKPSEIDDDKFHKYLVDNKCDPPEYVIPIKDRWFCMIIYPSLAAKIEAESDQEIRELIKAIKPDSPTNKPYNKTNPAQWEKYNKPIEIDLDACRNF